ncbi:hypothetical protein D1B31_01755 [Neobacillus notoginsengisoli]|uniref:HYR domain-containing protein n=1 Tax=Neobacillus notoginsengisoli TaxID=1578198 RepID=A0A417YZU0_9BACI|nr:PxKF domain-containing protein [Neobacillus notoginsengisoli]RHW43410.1 hypothetical protein D1B31_01755 [Neobacillus notoginsengisoli]
MKKTGLRKMLHRKALSAVTALAISGLVPAGFAIAGELEINAELVASSMDVYVEQGETKSFNFNVKSDGNVTDADVTVPTKFAISANGTFTSSDSTTVKLNDKDMEKKVSAVIKVDPNLQAGKYTFNFITDQNVTFTNNNQKEAKLENKKPDSITFVVTKKLVSDTTAPVVTATPDRAPNANGWYNQDVTVSFSAVDEEGGSGLVPESVSAPAPVSEDGIHTVTGTAKDKAGNEGSGSITIKLDKTAPTISGSADREANEHGWYNKDVTVTFEAEDNLSGVADYTRSVPLTEEGKDQSARGTAVDNAGNSSSTEVLGINIDKTKPVINVEDGGTYKLNQTVTWSASDELSGLATAATGTIDTTKVGPQTQTITATDNAGNTRDVTISYNVEYNFGEVLQPINKDGSSVFKAGSTVPVKFQLTDSKGAFISTANATLRYAKSSNQVFGDSVEAVSTSAATSGNLFRYDASSKQYIFNFSTKGLTGGTYQITITLDDGTTHKVVIGLK